LEYRNKAWLKRVLGWTVGLRASNIWEYLSWQSSECKEAERSQRAMWLEAQKVFNENLQKSKVRAEARKMTVHVHTVEECRRIVKLSDEYSRVKEQMARLKGKFLYVCERNTNSAYNPYWKELDLTPEELDDLLTKRMNKLTHELNSLGITT